MRAGWTAHALLLFCLLTWGCTRGGTTQPPIVPASVAPAKGAALEEKTDQAKEEREEDDDPSDEAGADRVKPCDARSNDHDDARAAVDAVDRRIDALADTDDPSAVREEIEALLEHPCLELAASDPKEPLEFDSGLSLKTWWSDSGRSWLDSYLEVEARRYVYAPSTPRKTLTARTAAKDHPMRPLLCPTIAPDETCGKDTLGWVRRAEEKLAIIAERNSAGRERYSCEEEAKKEKRSERYAAFRNCLDTGRTTRRALPLGRFKAPSDGWFVLSIEGRSCTNVHAFDLTTGSTYRVRECSGSTTSPAAAGRVPLAALREAAWMFMLAGETQDRVRESAWVSIPAKLPIERDRGETISLGMIGGGGHYDTTTWAWLRDPKGTGVLRAQAEGTFTRPPDEGFEHALSLMAVAEDAFEDGCAPALPPARVSWAPLSDTSRAYLARGRPSSRACTKKP